MVSLLVVLEALLVLYPWLEVLVLQLALSFAGVVPSSEEILALVCLQFLSSPQPILQQLEMVLLALLAHQLSLTHPPAFQSVFHPDFPLPYLARFLFVIPLSAPLVLQVMVRDLSD